MISSIEILTADEIQTVLAANAPYRKKWRVNTLLNRIVFRLSCCCGLRRKEIAELKIGSVSVIGERPCITVQAHATKRSSRTGKGKKRIVPLWWDSGTLDDLRAYMAIRQEVDGAKPGDPFLCVPHKRAWAEKGAPLGLWSVWNRWKTATKCLGPSRQRQLHTHSGRHTFISWALHIGINPVAVMAAVGHSNLQTTTLYSHVVDDLARHEIFSTPRPKNTPIRSIRIRQPINR